MDNEVLTARLARSARSIQRLTLATRGISGLLLAIAFFMLLYAFSRLERHTDDFVGFGLISLGIAAFATLLWSTAAFHAAFGDTLHVVALLHHRLELLGTRSDELAPGPFHGAQNAPAPTPSGTSGLALRDRSDPPLPTLAIDEPGALAETRVAVVKVDDAGVVRSVEPRDGGPSPPSEPAANEARSEVGPGGSGEDAGGAAASGGAANGAVKPAREVAPPLAMRACRHCDGEIRADATRCRYCLQLT